MALEKGDLLNGRYRIIEVLGHGGMGAVYRALDESLGVEVAVKENLFVTEDYARQFRLEAVILASLRHPNLPRVTDHFVMRNEGQYLVMDFIPGEDLRQILERQGPISEADVIRIGTAICDALTYLHSRKPPVLHRDIKLGNIKVAPDGHVCLVDFGLAKMADANEMTMTGARAMTPGYSPPEQYGSARTDARSDVYALGATLYAALTGFIPEDSLARVMDGLDLTPVRERNKNVSERLAAVIERAMEPQPINRYQSAEAFKYALLGISDSTTEAPQMPPVSDSSLISPPTPALATSGPDDEPYFVARPKKRSFAGVWFLLLFILAIGGSGYFFYVNPAFAPEPLRTFLVSPTLTATITLTATLTPSAEPTNTSTVTPTLARPTVTATPRPSATPSPQSTDLQLTATPLQSPIVAAPTIILSPTIVVTPSATATPGLQLAYASIIDNVSQLFLLDVSSGATRQLTTEPDGACQPDWSPDGQKIVFVSPCKGKANIYDQGALFVLDVASGQVTTLLDDESGSFDPAWSPDGQFVAFSSIRSGSPQIYIITLADQSIVRLTNTDSAVQSFQPVWSADGKTIFYTVKRLGLEQIWKIGADGKGPEQYVRTGGGYWEFGPVFSRDGTLIYFSQSNKDGTSPAWLMRWVPNGTALPERMPVDPPIVHISLSPDGLWMAYEGADGLNQDIYLLNLTTNAVSRLTTSSAVDFDPVWRP